MRLKFDFEGSGVSSDQELEKSRVNLLIHKGKKSGPLNFKRLKAMGFVHIINIF